MDICVLRGPKRSIWARVVPPDPKVSLTAAEPAQWAFGREEAPLEYFPVPGPFRNLFLFYPMYGLREPVLLKPDDPGFDTVCDRFMSGMQAQSPMEITTAFICQYGLQLSLGLTALPSITGSLGKCLVLGGAVAFFPMQRQAMTAALGHGGFSF